MIGDPRASVRNAVGSLFASDRFPEEHYDAPLGDEGLFGADSITWQVHADVSMFVGGIAALMLQALHPRAARVVAGSSRFREQPLHRLSRTGSFVAATTYGATPVAEAVIARVRAVHERIPGASEPDLLTWIHVAEATSFLAAYRRYRVLPMAGADIDRYYAEMAVVADRLGALRVPRSRAEVRAYYAAVRPELARSDDSVDLLEFLHRPISRNPAVARVHGLFVQAAEAQLPGWARELHGIRLVPGADRLVIRPATWTVLEGLRRTMGSSPILTAARRRSLAVAS